MRLEKHLKYLKDARNCAELSTCMRRGYGAVIVKDDRTISNGYNGASRGLSHCCDTGVCWREVHHVPSGERYEEYRAVHAEQNALYRASWEDKHGATMYLFGFNRGNPINARPCRICEKHIRKNGTRLS